MEFSTWDVENMEKKLQDDQKKREEKLNLRYDDNYVADHKSYCAFPAVMNFLASSMDYAEKGLSKVDTIDGLRDKLKNDLEVSLLSSMDQRLNHVTSQHPNPQYSLLILLFLVFFSLNL